MTKYIVKYNVAGRVEYKTFKIKSEAMKFAKAHAMIYPTSTKVYKNNFNNVIFGRKERIA